MDKLDCRSPKVPAHVRGWWVTCDKPGWPLKDQADLCVCKCMQARLGLSPSASSYFLLLFSPGPQLSCLVNAKKFTEIFAECINWSIRTPSPWTFLAIFLTFIPYVVNPMRSLWSVLRIWPVFKLHGHIIACQGYFSNLMPAFLELTSIYAHISCMPNSSTTMILVREGLNPFTYTLYPPVVEPHWGRGVNDPVPKWHPHPHLLSQLIHHLHPCS